MNEPTNTCWGVFSRSGKRTHFRVCVATEAAARAALERIESQEESVDDEYWVAELEAEAEAWARSMNLYEETTK